jgi:Conjugative transposon, TraM/Domain of unknown function (DUF4138)
MTISPKLKFLLMAPLFVVPFLCAIFHTLGGGRGSRKDQTTRAMGLNTQLPEARLNPKQVLENKMSAYIAADQDSMRKRGAQQRDQYLLVGKVSDSARVLGLRRPVQAIIQKDPRADQLLQQLGRLQQSMRQQAPVPAHVENPPVAIPPTEPPFPGSNRLPVRVADTAATDPQLEKLNSMLDKVIRIQHPGEGKPLAAPAGNENADEVMPADSTSNAIAAVIPSNQTLVTGGTISLRLSQDVLIHGVMIPRGQLVYGVVSITNYRMLVHIRSLWDGRNLYNTDLLVYDLDGLPGIHIPGMLSQDVAKQSANESVNGLNLGTYDPSIGAQAANAGIQAAKTFLGRNVRLVRVSVRAGYQVLLRNTRMNISRPAHTPAPIKDSSVSMFWFLQIQPPGFVPGGRFIRRCQAEGMELGVQGIYLQDSLLWIALRWRNHSPISYQPDYCRWVIRDRRSFKRTAEQELTLVPVYKPALVAIAGDSTVGQWTGFRPFALVKDKELVLEVGERNGGRTLTLVIDHQQILHAKTSAHDETTTE